MAMVPASSTPHALQVEDPNSRHQHELQVRRVYRQQDSAEFAAMTLAHAQGLPMPPRTVVTSIAGDIMGQRTRWHRAVREVAKRTIDYSVREHKKFPREWKWMIDTIQKELDGMFNFEPVPVRRDVLEKYVAGFIGNDRAKWKAYWTENEHAQHPECPDAAFAMLDKYWSSTVGMKESEVMKEKCSRVGTGENSDMRSSRLSSPINKRSRTEPIADYTASDSENQYYSDDEPEYGSPVRQHYSHLKPPFHLCHFRLSNLFNLESQITRRIPFKAFNFDRPSQLDSGLLHAELQCIYVRLS